ncbi:MAG TPA: hypothetical protein VK477_01935 [Acidobacteriota bacterium]|nr:hypothetical protein [Acidobacteriota bacterium]
MTTAHLAPVLLLPLFAWRIYLRARRNEARQQFRRSHLVARLVLVALLTAWVMTLACPHLPSLEAGIGGLLVGALIGVAGLRLTRWEMTPEGNFYTPNAFLGGGVVLVLAGQMLDRSSMLLTEPRPAAAAVDFLFHCPFTLGVFGLSAGYYLAYSAGVLARGRKVG